MMDIDDDTLEYLDNVAAIVASLLEFDKEQTKIGEPPDESRKALITLGEAYMFLYMKVLNDN